MIELEIPERKCSPFIVELFQSREAEDPAPAGTIHWVVLRSILGTDVNSTCRHHSRILAHSRVWRWGGPRQGAVCLCVIVRAEDRCSRLFAGRPRDDAERESRIGYVVFNSQ